MNYILCDIDREHFFPFTITKPVADLRVGILTIREKWECFLGERLSTVTEPYLIPKFPSRKAAQNTCINASVLPDTHLVEAIRSLHNGESLWRGKLFIAACGGKDMIAFPPVEMLRAGKKKSYRRKAGHLQRIWDLFLHNDAQIRADFDLLTAGRKSAAIPKSVSVRNKSQVFIEPGAVVTDSVLNAGTGPIYIGADAEVMEGCTVRGPFALCSHGVLKMGARIYGATTLGPWCKAGGEINNSIMSGYSNKAHEGFLGNSVIGEWCNLGAGTNNSNLKNNYSDVSVWNFRSGGMKTSGLRFCGLFMGDYSRSGIDTMFNTGTVTGVSANIFGGGFPPKFIPSFSWGGAEGFERYRPAKAMEAVAAMYKRRGKRFGKKDSDLFRVLYKRRDI